MAALDLRIGIDVGGTNTDAVVLDRDDRLLAKAKRPTSADVTSGITAAVDAVLAAPAVDRRRISHVMLGTTHATNAVLERRDLKRVAVVRIGAPSTTAIRPLFMWPDDLRTTVSAGEAIVRGGIEFDGREIVPFDADEVARFLEPLRGAVDAVAVTSVFASVSARHELEAEQVIRRVMGDGVHISLSHEIGTVGLLERENATVLNSALVEVAAEVAGALQTALATHGIEPATFFAQNDGTLMALEYALRYPVLTIGSGPANSMRGAAYLTGASDALVADIGGTSTDVGVLVNGFPRESSAAVEIGGIRTNFRMPDLLAVALGGGSVVANGDGRPVRVGPGSVGYELERRALVFGGDTPTLTDAAVAAGRASIGDREPSR
ncbi:MAG TPA: hydantoinase/oxoprolinase family protein, partial [Gaiellales bacterium]|nr:hydantoinase/oxoprolinase family protein [Gaiellales bacterium]